MHQHSLEQISFLEKFCTEKIANNTLTIQMAIPILSELAQHGSSVFSRLDDYLDSLSHNNGLTEYRDTLRELHKTTHKIGTDALKSFDKDVVKRLYHPRVPVYYGNQNNNRRLAVVFTTSYNNFYVSNMILAKIIIDLGYSFLCLKDPTGLQYSRGICEISQDWLSSLEWIMSGIEEIKPSNVIFLGFSSSGYSTLLAAKTIKPDTTLGFSICSTMVSGGAVMRSKLITDELYDLIPSDLKLDLASREITFPTHIRLYYGDESLNDTRHSLRLAGKKNVKVSSINGEGHICFRSHIAKNSFGNFFND